MEGVSISGRSHRCPTIKSVASFLLAAAALLAVAGSLEPPVTVRGDQTAISAQNGRIAFSYGTETASINHRGTRLNRLAGSAAEPDWSPNGRRIVYLCHEGAAQYSRGNQLCVMRADGSHKIQITHLRKGKESPAWSPDGKTIAFSMGGTPRNRDIYTIRASGAQLRHVTNDARQDNEPTWSPDGRKLAFIRNVSTRVSGNDNDVYVVQIQSRHMRALTTTPWHNEDSPDWSPNGDVIVFSRDTDRSRRIFVVRSDGSRLLKLTDRPAGGSDLTPTWSPNGRWVLYVRNLARLEKVRPAGGPAQELWRCDAQCASPDWAARLS